MENRNTSWVSSYMIARPEKGLDQLTAATYWRYILMGCVPNPAFDSLFSLPAKSGFCLCGEPGTGRHSVAKAFAGAVPAAEYEGKGYVTCMISGVNLLRERAEETEQRVRELFSGLLQSPAVLIIDTIQTDSLRNMVAAEYERLKPACPFTLFVIEEDEETARRSWERILLFCRFALPDMAERASFFNLEDNYLPAGKWTDNGAAWLAAHTEGMNYAQLRTLVMMGNYFMKVNLVSRYKGDLEAAMEGIQDGKVFFEKKDFEDLLDMVRRQVEEEEELPVPEPEEEKKEEPEEKEPLHLVIDNLPKVIHVPVQSGPATLPAGQAGTETPGSGQELDDPPRALTPEAAEKEVLRRLEERRRKREALRQARMQSS